MRKILKAAAMLTVGGALLSTSAFAALSGTAVYNASTGKIDVNVSGLGKGESTIMVLKSATAIDAIPSTVADADIVYIDQKTATADGTASYSIDPGTRGADVNTYYVFAGGTNESSAKFLGAATRTIAATGVVIKENGEDAATTKELTSNQTAAFTAVVSPENATETVTWTVKQGETDVTTSVLSVAADGVATFTAPEVAANTDYVVTAKAGTVSDSITITVKPATVAVTGVTIHVDGADKTAAELAIGGTAALTATVAPENATDKTVTWAAKQGETDVTTSVLSVAEGVATFTAPSVDADTVYTVTATAGGVTDTVEITVKATTTSGRDFITTADTDKGTIKVDKASVTANPMGLVKGCRIVSLELSTTAYTNAGGATAGYAVAVVDAEGNAINGAAVFYSAERAKYVAVIPTSVTEYKFEVLGAEATANDVIAKYGNMNEDKLGAINALDVAPFTKIVKNTADSPAATSMKKALIADVNGDGNVNALDVGQFTKAVKKQAYTFGVLAK